MPSLDPHVAQLLDLVARAKRPPLHHLAPADAKIAYEKSSPIVDIPSIALDHVHDLTVPARDGYAIPVRTYAAREASWADPLPLLVYFHGGDSAGGTLAAVTAIEARNRGLAPVLQLLIYPGTTARETTPSHHAFAEGYLLTQAMIAWFFAQYLRSDADRDDWRFAPLDGGGQGADVRGVCPAWIAVAGFDPIRDAGIGYADKLRAAGVPVALKVYEGMIHDFFKLGTLRAGCRGRPLRRRRGAAPRLRHPGRIGAPNGDRGFPPQHAAARALG